MRTLLAVLGALAVTLSTAPAQSLDTIEHVVEPGETLWSIAALSDVYADPYLWPVIYKFNRDQIKDPARIYAGQRLQIPIQIDGSTRQASYVEAGRPGSVPVPASRAE
jgi:nucleoid-associated protein YgaU